MLYVLYDQTVSKDLSHYISMDKDIHLVKANLFSSLVNDKNYI